MEKQILTTLFLLFAAFSFILFADIGMGGVMLFGGLSTVLVTALLMRKKLEGGVE